MTTVAKKLFKGSVLRLVSLLAKIIVGFFMLPFLIHSLGDEQYGIWVLVGTIIGFYGLLDVGMGSALSRFLVRAMHGDKANEVNVTLSNAVFLFCGTGLLSLLITASIILLVPQFVESVDNVSKIQIMVGILGAQTALTFPLAVFGSILHAKYRFDIASYIKLFSLFIRTVLIVVFVSQGYGIVAVSVIVAIDALFSALLIVYFARKLVPSICVKWGYTDKSKLKEYLDYGKHTYVINISDRIRMSIDDFVIAAVIGLSAVTHYTVGMTLIFYFSEMMASIFGVIGPVLHKYHKLNMWESLRIAFFAASEVTTFASILIGIIMVVLGESFIAMWMGQDYQDAYIVLVILTVSSIVGNAQRPGITILFAIAKHKYYAKIIIIEAVANLSLSILLGFYYGIYGVALGTVIPSLISKLLFIPKYICRQLDVSLYKYYGLLLKYITVGIFIVICAKYGLNYVSLNSYLDLVIAGAVISILYCFLCLRFLMTKQAIGYIKDMVPEKIKYILDVIV